MILELNQILDELFEVKIEDYINLIFFIVKQQYRNIYNEEIRIQLIENFFKNKLLIKKSCIFLTMTFKDLRPEIFKNKRNEKEQTYINNFMNLTENKKLIYIIL